MTGLFTNKLATSYELVVNKKLRKQSWIDDLFDKVLLTLA